VHLVGSSVFLFSTVSYMVELLSLALVYEPVAGLNYMRYGAVVYVCAAGFGAAYGALYFLDSESMWLWENLAFIFMVMGNLVFFWLHPFDPTEAARREEEEGEEQAAPLIITSRA
jgi:4-amino-4-deoxy-L-arabinose transferase-like glycosyltransferase